MLPNLPSQDMSFIEFNNKLHELSRIVDDRADKLGALDSLLMQDRLKKKMLPSVMPVTQSGIPPGSGRVSILLPEGAPSTKELISLLPRVQRLLQQRMG